MSSQVRRRGSQLLPAWALIPFTGLHPHDLITPKAPAPTTTTAGFRVSTYESGGCKHSVHHMLQSGEEALQPEWPILSTHVDSVKNGRDGGVFENDWKEHCSLSK